MTANKILSPASRPTILLHNCVLEPANFPVRCYRPGIKPIRRAILAFGTFHAVGKKAPPVCHYDVYMIGGAVFFLPLAPLKRFFFFSESYLNNLSKYKDPSLYGRYESFVYERKSQRNVSVVW